jgi:hypothetical protein
MLKSEKMMVSSGNWPGLKTPYLLEEFEWLVIHKTIKLGDSVSLMI